MEPNNNWMLSAPTFESDLLNPQLRFAYWVGHRDFAYDLIRFVRPPKIVELGSQYGCSLFSFCQAVKDFQLPCEIHAVDIWSGDVGAPDSGDIVFEKVKAIQAKYYEEVNLTLHSMMFENACPLFEDNSIDLIHIDGGHRFEDVDRDFSTWLPKLKENGIILFHDVYSTIDSGSCEHWNYIKEKYSDYFEFPHSCGLGVLFPKGAYWLERLRETDFFPYLPKVYQYRAEYRYMKERFEELSGLYEERYAAIQQQSEMIRERDATIAEQGKMLEERYEAIQEQSRMIRERDDIIAHGRWWPAIKRLIRKQTGR